MTNEQVPQGTTGEVSADESFEAYEQKFLAGASGSSHEAATSDVSEPAEDSEDKTASDSETEDEQEQDTQKEDEQPKGKGKGGYQRRIDKLTGKIRELESQLAGKPAAQATEAAKTEPATPQFEKPEPQLEDFESIAEYTKAAVTHALERKAFDDEQAGKQKAAQQEAETLMSAWKARVAEVKKEHTDYDDVIESADGIQLSPAHQRLFLKSEVGAHVAYHLATHREDLQQFADMDLLDAGRYFGKLEASISGTTAHTNQPPATRAPRPPSTVGTRGAAPADTYDERLAGDFEAWERARNAQLRKRGL